VEGKINHFIFKALIFWKKGKVSLAMENCWSVELTSLGNECSVAIKGSNHNETIPFL
jgi:hypothetical protein